MIPAFSLGEKEGRVTWLPACPESPSSPPSFSQCSSVPAGSARYFRCAILSHYNYSASWEFSSVTTEIPQTKNRTLTDEGGGQWRDHKELHLLPARESLRPQTQFCVWILGFSLVCDFAIHVFLWRLVSCIFTNITWAGEAYQGSQRMFLLSWASSWV